MTGAAKRWDQFGRYTLERRDEGTKRLIGQQSLGPMPITFGDAGRSLCLPSSRVAVTVVNDNGFFALAVNAECGLYVRLTPEAARGIASNLIRMAEHLEGLPK